MTLTEKLWANRIALGIPDPSPRPQAMNGEDSQKALEESLERQRKARDQREKDQPTK